jgi:hypothetical protein
MEAHDDEVVDEHEGEGEGGVALPPPPNMASKPNEISGSSVLVCASELFGTYCTGPESSDWPFSSWSSDEKSMAQC